MEAIRLETVVPSDGILKVSDPDLKAGEEVEVIVLRQPKRDADSRYPLRGTPFRYDEPFAPVVPPSDAKLLRSRLQQ